MAATIYVVLTADASSSLASTADASRGSWKPHGISSLTDNLAPLWRLHEGPDDRNPKMITPRVENQREQRSL
jgi:hypothetical protein